MAELKQGKVERYLISPEQFGLQTADVRSLAVANARESLALPWREVLWALRRLEARGTIRGGRFVTGFVGEQYVAGLVLFDPLDADRIVVALAQFIQRDRFFAGLMFWGWGFLN